MEVLKAKEFISVLPNVFMITRMSSATHETGQGVRISCGGDIDILHAKKFIPVTIASSDPVFEDLMIEGDLFSPDRSIPSFPISPRSHQLRRRHRHSPRQEVHPYNDSLFRPRIRGLYDRRRSIQS